VAELVVDLFVSVDGYARGRRSPGYFGFGGPDLDGWIAQEMERGRHQVMGRRTYQMLSAIPDIARDEGWSRMATTATTVFSRTLDAVAWPGATLCSEDAVATVRRLKTENADLRTIGSLSIVRQLLGAGLVDRLRLLVFPLVVGETGEEPFFGGLPDLALDLVGQSVLDGRIVLSEYRPAGPPPYGD
jgi:dihydrofolate reductase